MNEGYDNDEYREFAYRQIIELTEEANKLPPGDSKSEIIGKISYLKSTLKSPVQCEREQVSLSVSIIATIVLVGLHEYRMLLLVYLAAFFYGYLMNRP